MLAENMRYGMWKKTNQMYENRESVDVEKACVGAALLIRVLEVCCVHCSVDTLCCKKKPKKQLRHQICQRHFLHCYKCCLTATSTSPETTKTERAMKERQSALGDSGHGPAGR